MRDQGIAFTPELLAAVRKRDADDAENREAMEIWPDMAPGVLTFLAMQTQWRRAMTGELMGLEYAALRPTADLLCLVLDTQAFHDVRTMEDETLRVARENRR